jgi:hypothetical protein
MEHRRLRGIGEEVGSMQAPVTAPFVAQRKAIPPLDLGVFLGVQALMEANLALVDPDRAEDLRPMQMRITAKMTIQVPYLPDEIIERDAEALLAEYAHSRSVTLEPPIPIEDLVEKHLKLRIEFDDLHKVLGVPQVGPDVAQP